MIFGKIYEMDPPQLDDYIMIYDYAYQAEDFVLMEGKILGMVNFSLNNSGCYDLMCLVLVELDVSLE